MAITIAEFHGVLTPYGMDTFAALFAAVPPPPPLTNYVQTAGVVNIGAALWTHPGNTGWVVKTLILEIAHNDNTENDTQFRARLTRLLDAGSANGTIAALNHGNTFDNSAGGLARINEVRGEARMAELHMINPDLVTYLRGTTLWTQARKEAVGAWTAEEWRQHKEKLLRDFARLNSVPAYITAHPNEFTALVYGQADSILGNAGGPPNAPGHAPGVGAPIVAATVAGALPLMIGGARIALLERYFPTLKTWWAGNAVRNTVILRLTVLDALAWAKTERLMLQGLAKCSPTGTGNDVAEVLGNVATHLGFNLTGAALTVGAGGVGANQISQPNARAIAGEARLASLMRYLPQFEKWLEEEYMIRWYANAHATAAKTVLTTQLNAWSPEEWAQREPLILKKLAGCDVAGNGNDVGGILGNGLFADYGFHLCNAGGPVVGNGGGIAANTMTTAIAREIAGQARLAVLKRYSPWLESWFATHPIEEAAAIAELKQAAWTPAEWAAREPLLLRALANCNTTGDGADILPLFRNPAPGSLNFNLGLAALAVDPADGPAQIGAVVQLLPGDARLAVLMQALPSLEVWFGTHPAERYAAVRNLHGWTQAEWADRESRLLQALARCDIAGAGAPAQVAAILGNAGELGFHLVGTAVANHAAQNGPGQIPDATATEIAGQARLAVLKRYLPGLQAWLVEEQTAGGTAHTTLAGNLDGWTPAEWDERETLILNALAGCDATVGSGGVDVADVLGGGAAGRLKFDVARNAALAIGVIAANTIPQAGAETIAAQARLGVILKALPALERWFATHPTEQAAAITQLRQAAWTPAVWSVRAPALIQALARCNPAGDGADVIGILGNAAAPLGFNLSNAAWTINDDNIADHMPTAIARDIAGQARLAVLMQSLPQLAKWLNSHPTKKAAALANLSTWTQAHWDEREPILLNALARCDVDPLATGDDVIAILGNVVGELGFNLLGPTAPGNVLASNPAYGPNNITPAAAKAIAGNARLALLERSLPSLKAWLDEEAIFAVAAAAAPARERLVGFLNLWTPQEWEAREPLILQALSHCNAGGAGTDVTQIFGTAAGVRSLAFPIINNLQAVGPVAVDTMSQGIANAIVGEARLAVLLKALPALDRWFATHPVARAAAVGRVTAWAQADWIANERKLIETLARCNSTGTGADIIAILGNNPTALPNVAVTLANAGWAIGADAPDRMTVEIARTIAGEARLAMLVRYMPKLQEWLNSHPTQKNRAITNLTALNQQQWERLELDQTTLLAGCDSVHGTADIAISHLSEVFGAGVTPGAADDAGHMCDATAQVIAGQARVAILLRYLPKLEEWFAQEELLAIAAGQPTARGRMVASLSAWTQEEWHARHSLVVASLAKCDVAGAAHNALCDVFRRGLGFLVIDNTLAVGGPAVNNISGAELVRVGAEARLAVLVRYIPSLEAWFASRPADRAATIGRLAAWTVDQWNEREILLLKGLARADARPTANGADVAAILGNDFGFDFIHNAPLTLPAQLTPEAARAIAGEARLGMLLRYLPELERRLESNAAERAAAIATLSALSPAQWRDRRREFSEQLASCHRAGDGADVVRYLNSNLLGTPAHPGTLAVVHPGPAAANQILLADVRTLIGQARLAAFIKDLPSLEQWFQTEANAAQVAAQPSARSRAITNLGNWTPVDWACNKKRILDHLRTLDPTHGGGATAEGVVQAILGNGVLVAVGCNLIGGAAIARGAGQNQMPQATALRLVAEAHLAKLATEQPEAGEWLDAHPARWAEATGQLVGYTSILTTTLLGAVSTAIAVAAPGTTLAPTPGNVGNALTGAHGGQRLLTTALVNHSLGRADGLPNAAEHPIRGRARIQQWILPELKGHHDYVRGILATTEYAAAIGEVNENNQAYWQAFARVLGNVDSTEEQIFAACNGLKLFYDNVPQPVNNYGDLNAANQQKYNQIYYNQVYKPILIDPLIKDGRVRAAEVLQTFSTEVVQVPRMDPHTGVQAVDHLGNLLFDNTMPFRRNVLNKTPAQLKQIAQKLQGRGLSEATVLSALHDLGFPRSRATAKKMKDIAAETHVEKQQQLAVLNAAVAKFCKFIGVHLTELQLQDLNRQDFAAALYPDLPTIAAYFNNVLGATIPGTPNPIPLGDALIDPGTGGLTARARTIFAAELETERTTLGVLALNQAQELDGVFHAIQRAQLKPNSVREVESLAVVARERQRLILRSMANWLEHNEHIPRLDPALHQPADPNNPTIHRDRIELLQKLLLQQPYISYEEFCAVVQQARAGNYTGGALTFTIAPATGKITAISSGAGGCGLAANCLPSREQFNAMRVESRLYFMQTGLTAGQPGVDPASGPPTNFDRDYQPLYTQARDQLTGKVRELTGRLAEIEANSLKEKAADMFEDAAKNMQYRIPPERLHPETLNADHELISRSSQQLQFKLTQLRNFEKDLQTWEMTVPKDSAEATARLARGGVPNIDGTPAVPGSGPFGALGGTPAIPSSREVRTAEIDELRLAFRGCRHQFDAEVEKTERQLVASQVILEKYAQARSKAAETLAVEEHKSGLAPVVVRKIRNVPSEWVDSKSMGRDLAAAQADAARIVTTQLRGGSSLNFDSSNWGTFWRYCRNIPTGVGQLLVLGAFMYSKGWGPVSGFKEVYEGTRFTPPVPPVVLAHGAPSSARAVLRSETQEILVEGWEEKHSHRVQGYFGRDPKPNDPLCGSFTQADKGRELDIHFAPTGKEDKIDFYATATEPTANAALHAAAGSDLLLHISGPNKKICKELIMGYLAKGVPETMIDDTASLFKLHSMPKKDRAAFDKEVATWKTEMKGEKRQTLQDTGKTFEDHATTLATPRIEIK